MDLGRDYLEIALLLRRLVAEWVEGYVGPSDLEAEVDAGPATPAGELRDRAEALRERVRDQEPAADRRAWLSAQLEAISTALLWLSGDRLEYGELFALCHGAAVVCVPDRRFEEAHALLDGALPGSGDVAVRFRAWRETHLVPRGRLREGLELVGKEMRARSRELFDLPHDEGVTWEVVADAPFAGHADYLGELRTLIRINADLPISSAELLELVCHEAYPGHHTESVCKSVGLIRGFGRTELGVYVHPTPQAVISEGLASYALEALLGEQAEEIAAGSLRPLGIPYDAETAAVVRRAEELLLPVRSNIALMLGGGATSAEAHDYAQAWMLDSPEQIKKAIELLEARSWLPYESCYPVGRELCRSYVSAGGSFEDLLYRQLTPSDLGDTARRGATE